MQIVYQLLVPILVIVSFHPALASAQTEAGIAPPLADESYTELFMDAVMLQQQRRFADASKMLEQIIEENEGRDAIVQEALNHLVYNHLDWQNGTAVEVASRALRRYPELVENSVLIPPSVNELYDRLRLVLFGSLTIKKPSGCDVFLDGVQVGTTPYIAPYLEVGEYELKVTKERKHDFVQTLNIEPGGDYTFEEVPLAAQRDLRYWATRLGLGSVAAGTIYYLANGATNDADSPEPLAGPPGVPE